MTEQQIKTCQSIDLKPNTYFTQVEKPFLYQKRGILTMLARERMVLGDDVGLGKTLQSVVAFSYLKAQNPILKAVVFTELATLYQWEREFNDLTPELKTKVVTASLFPDVGSRKNAFTQPYDVLITNYHSIYRHLSDILDGAGEFVIFADEPTFFKNPSAKVYPLIETLSQAASRVYGLTGTLIENKLDDAWGILGALLPGRLSKDYFFGNFTTRVLVRVNKSRYAWQTLGYHNLDGFRELIEPVYYGRLQTDPEVQQALPECIDVDLPVRMGSPQSSKTQEAVNRILEMADGELCEIEAITAITRAQQIVDMPSVLDFAIPSAKMEALQTLLEGTLSNKSVVVFSKFAKVIDKIEVVLSGLGIENVRITGSETDVQREYAKNRFQCGLARVILITKAGLRGINLQTGECIIWFDLPWNHSLYRQGVGRLKRTGSQHKSILSYRLLAQMSTGEKTIDNYILDMIRSKAGVSNAVIGDEDTLAASDVVYIVGRMKECARNAGISATSTKPHATA